MRGPQPYVSTGPSFTAFFRDSPAIWVVVTYPTKLVNTRCFPVPEAKNEEEELKGEVTLTMWDKELWGLQKFSADVQEYQAQWALVLGKD